jgi:GNAT superfamily N-acetyltransferase
MQSNLTKIEIKGYVPGAIARITELHALYYSQQWGLGLAFEAEIARDLADFLLRFDPAHDGFWLAVMQDEIVGAIAIDGSQAQTEGARLRWFILAPEYRGHGIGQLLMQTAIDFCRQVEFDRVYLWTFAGLTTARHLYDKFGFVLSEQHQHSDWGRSVLHQKFDLTLSPRKT